MPKPKIKLSKIMKTVTSNIFKALLGAMLLSSAIVTPVSAEPKGVVHLITGSGKIVIPRDFFFPGSEGITAATTISARQKADGTVEGFFMFHVWIESRPEPFVTLGEVNCLFVEGNTGYWGGVIRSSDNPFTPPGSAEVGSITDTNGDGPDTIGNGPAFIFLAPGQDCTARPAIPQTPIASGNFILR